MHPNSSTATNDHNDESLPSTRVNSISNSCNTASTRISKQSEEQTEQQDEQTEQPQSLSQSRNIPPPTAFTKVVSRLALRTTIYVLYDAAGQQLKESSRVTKVMLETIVDEALPPPSRHEMTIARQFSEYLAPPAISSIIWSTLKLRPQAYGRIAFTSLHRAARHLLINRLFFRLGTLQYNLTSLIGIICCFFREELLLDILSFRRWPAYFSPVQGIVAIARSIVYAAAFAVPLAHISTLASSRRRRGNAKRLLFAIVLSQVAALQRLLRVIAGSTVN